MNKMKMIIGIAVFTMAIIFNLHLFIGQEGNNDISLSYLIEKAYAQQETVPDFEYSGKVDGHKKEDVKRENGEYENEIIYNSTGGGAVTTTVIQVPVLVEVRCCVKVDNQHTICNFDTDDELC